MSSLERDLRDWALDSRSNHQIGSRTIAMVKAAADRIAELEAELEACRLLLIEAQNPGIDMDEVRRSRNSEPPDFQSAVLGSEES